MQLSRSIDIETTPYRELRDYVAQNPEQRGQVLETLAYFDPLNLAASISCPAGEHRHEGPNVSPPHHYAGV